MKVSVIIPTYNGAHKILNVLNSLEQQSAMPDEVLVVIDGSTDDTAVLLRRQQFTFPSFRIIEQENGGRAKVRNKGAKEAVYELLLFLDDDTVPAPDCVSRHLHTQMKYSGILLSGAATDDLSNNHTDFARFKEQLSHEWESTVAKLDDTFLDADTVSLTAANCSVPRKMFHQLNGFDPELRDGEDFDLAFRALKSGIKVCLDSKINVLHQDETSCAVFIKRNRSYYNAGIQLARNKPALYYERFKDRINKKVTAKMRIFRIFCSKWWITSIDQDKWTWLPKKIRYRLYDWVVTANSTQFPDIVKL